MAKKRKRFTAEFKAKVALAKGAARAGTLTCSGEGGQLPEERAAAKFYAFQYSTGRFGATEENIKDADVIEIKLSQGAKPGMGGLLPGSKVTPFIAKLGTSVPSTGAVALGASQAARSPTSTNAATRDAFIPTSRIEGARNQHAIRRTYACSTSAGKHPFVRTRAELKALPE